MASVISGMRFAMRHYDIRLVCRQVSGGSGGDYWKRQQPAMTLLMTQWISRRHESTDKKDDPCNSGALENSASSPPSAATTSTSAASPTAKTASSLASPMKPSMKATKTKTILKNESHEKADTEISNVANSESQLISSNPNFKSNKSNNKKMTKLTATISAEPMMKDVDLTRMNVSKLKDELRAQGLSVGGNKSALIERLQNYWKYRQQQQQQEERTIENAIVDDQQKDVDAVAASSKPPHFDNNIIMTTTNNPSTTATADPSIFGRVAVSAAESCTPIDGHGSHSSSDDNVSDINHSVIRAASSVAAIPTHNHDVTVEYVRGMPQFTILLPSRNEKCRFVLKPSTHYVGDLINMLRTEDHGIDRAVILNEAGIRISSTSNIQSLLDAPFWLQINEQKHLVVPPQRERLDFDNMGNQVDDIRILVGRLYEALYVGEYYTQKEQEMKAQLEDLKYKIAPLEKKFHELSEQAARKSNSLPWMGLALMSVQFGTLARLTWWEYSWDIMEPVTYFVTYGTTMIGFAYYCITRQEYIIPEVRERQYLLDLHKRAKRANFDIDKYNSLKRQIAEIEYNLRRLQDPLNLRLPTHVHRAQEHTVKTETPTTPDDKTTTSNFKPQNCEKTGFKIPFFESKN